MSWKGTLLLVIVAAVAAFLLLGRSGSVRPPGAPLFGLDPARMDRIVIRDAGGETVLAKLDGSWFVRTGTPDRADAALVRSMISAALETAPLDTLRPSELKGPVSLEALDLRLPRRSLTLSDGKRSETLLFGIEGAGKDRIYARLDGEAPVHLVSSAVADLAFRPAAAFRDTRLTSLHAEDLESIVITAPGKTITLKRQGRDWKISTSAEHGGGSERADNDAVARFADSLLGAKVLRWMPSGTSAAACGLEPPAMEASFTARGETSPVTLSLGSSSKGATGDHPDSTGHSADSDRYALCSDRRGIALLKPEGSGMNPELLPGSLKDRHPSPVEPDAVDRIEIATGARPDVLIQLQRKKGTDDWESPGHPGTIAGSEVAAWIRSLNGLTAERFVAMDATGTGSRANPTVIRLIARLSENTAEEGAGEMTLSEISLTGLGDPEAHLLERGASEAMVMNSAPLRDLIASAAFWVGLPPPPTPSSVPSPEPASTRPSATPAKSSKPSRTLPQAGSSPASPTRTAMAR